MTETFRRYCLIAAFLPRLMFNITVFRTALLLYLCLTTADLGWYRFLKLQYIGTLKAKVVTAVFRYRTLDSFQYILLKSLCRHSATRGAARRFSTEKVCNANSTLYTKGHDMKLLCSSTRTRWRSWVSTGRWSTKGDLVGSIRTSCGCIMLFIYSRAHEPLSADDRACDYRCLSVWDSAVNAQHFYLDWHLGSLHF